MGRGPRGWRRSDERILEEFCERVAASGVDASEVEVACAAGVLRLDGRVATGEERAFLERLAEDVLGVARVDAEWLETEEELVGEPDPETRH
jgi:osmotically-inducible protein OsmY